MKLEIVLRSDEDKTEFQYEEIEVATIGDAFRAVKKRQTAIYFSLYNDLKDVVMRGEYSRPMVHTVSNNSTRQWEVLYAEDIV